MKPIFHVRFKTTENERSGRCATRARRALERNVEAESKASPRTFDGKLLYGREFPGSKREDRVKVVLASLSIVAIQRDI